LVVGGQFKELIDMDQLLSPRIIELRTLAAKIGAEVLKPRAADIDGQCRWPAEGLQALAQSGLLGLHVPLKFGGQEQGLLALAVISETLAQSCSSTSMCFGMHCVATAVIAAKATAHHEQHFLIPIAQGAHITTLALSEAGTGAHFYLPQCDLKDDKDHYRVNGTKHFVTNGGYADSYVLSTRASQSNSTAGEFNCLVVEKDRPGMTWLGPWQGLGMRGNSSRGLQLENLRIPKINLLGQEGDQIWYVFEVVAPYFLMAMAGTYLGIAQAALEITLNHIKQRHYHHSGEAIAQLPVVQHRLSELWLAVQQARCLIYQAAHQADMGDAGALVAILMAKVAAAEAVTKVTGEALVLCGGSAYRDNGDLSRLLRDAQAAHVMSPTTDLLKLWSGKALLGLPLI
jgi:isovaleryl-CoA dehydrogenase